MGQSFEATHRAIAIQLKKYQLTMAQFRVLMLVDLAAVPLSPRQIASLVSREKHTVSSLLIRMEDAGYIERMRADNDGRMIKAKIKPKGQLLLSRIRDGVMAYAHDMIAACLDTEEALKLASHLQRLRDHALGSCQEVANVKQRQSSLPFDL